MSALAAIFAIKGNTISGSDKQNSAYIDNLKKLGVKVFDEHSNKNILPNIDKVVYSLAISKDNPEIQEARRKKIPIFSYPEMIGELTREYYTIAICGTHGKTTTTAMTAKIFVENKFDPTVIVGSKLSFLNNNNYRIGKSKILILEACEYQRAFVNYHPNAIVMHNIDPDHFDSFKNFKSYTKAFKKAST